MTRGARNRTRTIASVVALTGALTGLSVVAGGPGASAKSTTVGASTDPVAAWTGARDYWACGWTGKGVDVALIDTGVAPVAGTGTIVNGPDLSFDLQTGGPAYLDDFGHGTHLASIINGHDAGVGVTGACRLKNNGGVKNADYPQATGYAGIAPGARVLNMKVGGNDGAVDVTQVIAAIDWTVQHRSANGLNVRVIALAYGANSTAGADTDVLSHAVEVARSKGIVVLASAGNDGSTRTDLAFPARNPDIIAVGAVDYMGSTSTSDWTVAGFASHGTSKRGVDILTPGVNVVGLRVPGSAIDSSAPSATGDRFIRGSGTSQSAAVAAGLSALLLQRYPTATPDQVKAMLQDASIKVKGNSWHQGAGAVLGDNLLTVAPRTVYVSSVKTLGTAPIESDRVDGTVTMSGVDLSGERDVQGNVWPGAAWASAASAGTSWSGGSWMGHPWTGGSSTASGWATATWSTSWAGPSFTSRGWDGGSWDGSRWYGSRWYATNWTGSRWYGSRWYGANWSGSAWS